MRQVKASETLKHLFETSNAVSSFASSNDTTALSVLKIRVEASLSASEQGAQKESSIMAFFMKNSVMNQIHNRPKLSLGVAVATVVLAFSTLVPFSYDKTIGYEVAFAGVDKNLALDGDKIQVFLRELGVDGAVVDVSGCEATCNLLITEIKSPEHARLVKIAFEKTGAVEVTHDIHALHERASGTLVELAKHNVWFGAINEKSDEEIEEIIRLHFGDDFDGSIFITRNDPNDGSTTISVDGSIGQLSKIGMNLSFNNDGSLSSDVINCVMVCSESTDPDHTCSAICLGEGGPTFVMKSGSDFTWIGNDGSSSSLKEKLEGLGIDASALGDFESGSGMIMMFTDESGETKTIRLDGAELDEATRQLLIDNGIDPATLKFGDGDHQMMFLKKMSFGDEAKLKVESFGWTEDESADAVAKDGPALPEGYALSQNYPNPFNPSTKIDFTLAQAEHVTVDVINVMGQIVRTLVDGSMGAGTHTIEWDSRSDTGELVSSGMYFYRFKAGDNVIQTRKMTLLK
ncbi:MAG: T9SS type A sorting domain-containing protein [candidate division Zixibacteria bacterium]|nr:T9SS type A sorting domain-containing protein [candidate division Zixibacteria bacterium]